MEQELPLTSIKIKDIFKDSKLTNFERLILALIKFYPEPKKQRELCLEAGINDSELSAWIKGRRGKEYEQFFEKYVERDVKTKGLKLKIHKDLVNKLIKIAKKDEKAKEIIVKSKYFEEFIEKLDSDELAELWLDIRELIIINGSILNKIISKDLRFLIYSVDEGILDLERAKEIFLEMLEANGVTKNEIIEKLNISEKALSCYIKQYLRFLASSPLPIPSLKEIVNDLRNEQVTHWYNFVKNFGGVIAWCILDNMRRIGGLSESYFLLPVLPIPEVFKDYSPLLLDGCNKEEVKEFIDYLAKRDDKLRTFFIDLFDNYLLKRAGKPLRIRKWVNIGCIIFLFEFDLKTLVYSNFESDFVKVKAIDAISIAHCPLDGVMCNLEITERFNCPKFKELLKKEVIEK